MSNIHAEYLIDTLVLLVVLLAHWAATHRHMTLSVNFQVPKRLCCAQKGYQNNTNVYYWLNGCCIKVSNISVHVTPFLHTLGQVFTVADNLIWLGSLGFRPSVSDFIITFDFNKCSHCFKSC